MSLLFNTRLVKCIKRIFPVVKHNISINSYKQTLAFPNSKQSVQTSIRYILSNRTNAAKSIVFGFSLLGLIGLDESDKDKELIYTIKRGLLHLQNDDYNAFEQTLHEALKMAYDLKNFDGVTYVYDVLANGAFMNKEYEKAKNLFTTVISRLFDQGGLEDDLNVLHISLKLSKIYEAQKDYKNSEIGYIYCVQRLEKKLKIDPENEDVLGLYAITLDAYARYLMNQGQTKNARAYFRKAYNASVKLNGEVFEMNVILLNDLGTLCYIQGKLDKALHYFKKAEQIGQHLPDMENFSTVYINLGNIYLKQGMLKEAEQNCVEGMKNAKRHRYDEGKKEAEICLAEIKSAMK
ncbi:tetratricopeptide repeat protein 19 homolog, mitochondrial [Acyrthosiphon pisum]|uniref:Tetratricopeptide repeat protein 19, mitochondrial n=1 Tax=Acyrthosiphon pisum TaxID=7029 RepID=A0A8R1W6F8_ACYPI|nr:tetratricopeptide repeat protein 19 homolog, mitochondrial [Acyrthosiphon pisum]|eukprot:XP_001949989.1 PREDICTED: tetratricopeptide repeat protein 19 homolog, mitochondrial [Acyrthosiphon pisum]